MIGVISDTHGLVRPEALSALAGSEVILHAGDIGSPEVIAQLQALAPVHAIRGNVDRGEWASSYPEARTVTVRGLRVHLVHDLSSLDPRVTQQGICAVVCGHSHKPAINRRDGVLIFNPGSAGPRRFRLPVCVGRMHPRHGTLEAEVVDLEI